MSAHTLSSSTTSEQDDAAEWVPCRHEGHHKNKNKHTVGLLEVKEDSLHIPRCMDEPFVHVSGWWDGIGGEPGNLKSPMFGQKCQSALRGDHRCDSLYVYSQLEGGRLVCILSDFVLSTDLGNERRSRLPAIWDYIGWAGLLKISVIIDDTFSFNMQACILSRPIALLSLSEQISYRDFFPSEHKNVFGAGIRRLQHAECLWLWLVK